MVRCTCCTDNLCRLQSYISAALGNDSSTQRLQKLTAQFKCTGCTSWTYGTTDEVNITGGVIHMSQWTTTWHWGRSFNPSAARTLHGRKNYVPTQGTVDISNRCSIRLSLKLHWIWICYQHQHLQRVRNVYLILTLWNADNWKVKSSEKEPRNEESSSNWISTFVDVCCVMKLNIR